MKEIIMVPETTNGNGGVEANETKHSVQQHGLHHSVNNQNNHYGGIAGGLGMVLASGSSATSTPGSANDVGLFPLSRLYGQQSGSGAQQNMAYHPHAHHHSHLTSSVGNSGGGGVVPSH